MQHVQQPSNSSVAFIEHMTSTNSTFDFAQLNKVISVAGIYKESAATYIADPQTLRNFKDAMSKTATIGEEVIVALTALDLAGLMYIADLLEVMQTADVRRHFGSPLSPPCA